jgi:hypothetical protein
MYRVELRSEQSAAFLICPRAANALKSGVETERNHSAQAGPPDLLMAFPM